MKLIYIGLLALFSYALAEKMIYRNYKVYKIIPKNEEGLKAIIKLKNQYSVHSSFEFWQEPTYVGNEVHLMVAPELKENIEGILGSLEVDTEIMIEDVQKNIDAENPQRRTTGTYSVNWTVYNTLDEINAWLEELAVEFPNEITVLRPGKTYEGRDIVGVKLDLTPNTNKQVVFLESNIHAREWISSATTTWILNQFLRSNDISVRQLATAYTWYFFPVINPDGFVFSHEKYRLWRKTRIPYETPTEICYGADPNRNWDYRWMTGGASSDPCSDLYAGPQAFSEPCINVMQKFISSIATTYDMVAYLGFHSYSQILLLPYGHTTDHLNNYNEMMEIGRVALANLTAVYGTAYTLGNIAETMRTSMDWVKATFHPPITYTYELRDKGEYGFILPADQIIPTAEETFISIISIFEEWAKRHPMK